MFRNPDHRIRGKYDGKTTAYYSLNYGLTIRTIHRTIRFPQAGLRITQNPNVPIQVRVITYPSTVFEITLS
jgi:hypothetical protein